MENKNDKSMEELMYEGGAKMFVSVSHKLTDILTEKEGNTKLESGIEVQISDSCYDDFCRVTITVSAKGHSFSEESMGFDMSNNRTVTLYNPETKELYELRSSEYNAPLITQFKKGANDLVNSVKKSLEEEE